MAVVAPFDQRYVPPVAVKVAAGEAQVKVAEVGETVAVGGVVLEVTVAEAVAVQPFVPVTVTV